MKLEQKLKQLQQQKEKKFKTFSAKIEDNFIDAIDTILKHYNIKKDEFLTSLLEEADVINISNKIKKDNKKTDVKSTALADKIKEKKEHNNSFFNNKNEL